MIPRSLLIRDRSQIGTYGNNNIIPTTRTEGSSTLLVAKGRSKKSAFSAATRNNSGRTTLLPVVSSSASSSSNSSKHSTTNTRQPQQQQQTTTVAAVAAAAAVESTPQSRVCSKSYNEWQRSYGGLLEFVISLIGGTIGAFVVLFLNGSHHSLVLSLLLPVVLSEVWEAYYLSSSSSTTKDTMLIHKVKQRAQLRYGQGLLMNAGLATILALKGGEQAGVDDGINLLLLQELFLRQIPIWISAWSTWTWLFCSTKSKSGNPTSTTKAIKGTKPKKTINSNRFQRKTPPRSYTA